MFGIHTMTLRLDFGDESDWFNLRNSIGHRSYGQYRQHGVVWFRFWHQQQTDFRCLFVQINPATMLNRHPFSVTSINDIRRLLSHAFRRWLRTRTSSRLPDVLDWQIQRIDYAVDIRCDSQEIAEAYATMACRGRLPRHLTTKYERTTHNLHTKNKRECFQIYAKQLQLRGRHPNTPPDVLGHYDGILRCEVQLDRKKIKSLAQAHHLGGYCLRHFLNDDLAASLITARLDEVFSPAGEHRTLTGAKQKIAAHQTNKQLTPAHATKLRSFLDFVSRYSSLEAARNACRNGTGIIKSTTTFDSRVDDLAAIGITLPCLPHQCPVTRLPRLIDLCRATISSQVSSTLFTVNITPYRRLIYSVSTRFYIDLTSVFKAERLLANGICRELLAKTGMYGLPPPVSFVNMRNLYEHILQTTDWRNHHVHIFMVRHKNQDSLRKHPHPASGTITSADDRGAAAAKVVFYAVQER